MSSTFDPVESNTRRMSTADFSTPSSLPMPVKLSSKGTLKDYQVSENGIIIHRIEGLEPFHGYRTPLQSLDAVCHYGESKSIYAPIDELLVKSFLAGAYIAMGYAFGIICGGGFGGVEFRAANPGVSKILLGFVFPVGLIAVVLTGAELFTSNVMYLSTALLDKKASWLGLLKNWILSYLGNFVGSLFFAGILAYFTDMFHGPYQVYLLEIATAKMNTAWWRLILKGIACNWLVCLAVFQSLTAEDIAGKMLAIHFPIWAFVTMGFEHCVANMFLIPCAIFYYPDALNFGVFIYAQLLPVTLGNILGGLLFVALPMWFLYGLRKPNVGDKLKAARKASLQEFP